MWLEAKIQLPSEALERIFPLARGGTHADEARNITARLNEAAGNPLPPEFFHYDAAGHPMHGRPPVRFGSFTRGVSVVGVGARGADLVDSLAHRFRRMWSDHVGSPLLETRYSGKNAVRWSYPRRYIVHGLAVEPPQPWSFTKDDWFETLKPLIAKAIASGLLAEAESVHGEDSSISNSEVLSEFGAHCVGVLSCERLGFKALHASKSGKEHGKAAIAVCRRVEFTLPIDLDGTWHVGRLPSRGFGLIRPAHMVGAAQKEAA